MKKLLVLVTIALILNEQTHFATFSIVAVDSVTGEIGSAGATCIDKTDILNYFGYNNSSFISDVTADFGAINSQCYYLEQNQNNAHQQLLTGKTASQIADWLVKNDCEKKPRFRQYGIVTLQGGHPEAFAYTGDSCFDYMGQRIGKYYSIQGNLLLGKEVLDSMESRFLNEKRSLKYKLMAALQGAKMVGADKRCEPYGTSTLLAFIKVNKPNSDGSDSLFSIGITTYKTQHVEPIDSLQTVFNIRTQGKTGVEKIKKNLLSIYPNPVTSQIQISVPILSTHSSQFFLFDYTGRLILSQRLPAKQQGEQISFNLSNQLSGVYFINLNLDGKDFYGKVVLVK